MANSRYINYGGCYVPETLVAPIQEIEQGFLEIKTCPHFKAEFSTLLSCYAGRPTPLTLANNLSKKVGRKLYLKREDLLHGGAHKTNNTLGQALLAKRLGKTRIIAETGAGQHGVATAMVGALLKIPVEIYMGAVDVKRQASNVSRMRLFGAKVHAVNHGSATLKDAINEAMRDWSLNATNTYYLFGTAAGPHPFPALVAFLQRIIGDEARAQILQETGNLPCAAFACVGGGSNAIGLFQSFLKDAEVRLIGAEAAGEGLTTPRHAATLLKGKPGVFHGMESLFLQNDEGQIKATHSISAGLDYPGIGPHHAALRDNKRAEYYGVTDDEALDAYQLIASEEGILAALESSHALALALRMAHDFNEDSCLLINLSGRGDKDLATYQEVRGDE